MLKTETIEFGIPKKEVKVDPYEGKALLIMHPAPTGSKGKTYRFELTKTALVQLNLIRDVGADERLVSFSFGEDVFIANTTNMKGTLDSNSQYNISMDGNFSNKNAHDYIAKLLTLDTTTKTLFDVVLDADDDASADFLVAKLIQHVNEIEEATIIAEEELATKIHLDEVEEVTPVNVDDTKVDDAIKSNDNF